MILPAIVALLVVPQTTQVEAVLEHRIGSADTGPEGVFVQVSDVASDEQGNVYVLDQRADEVRVFSPSGEYVRTIGRTGRGPGEFSRPNHIDVRDQIVTVLNPGGRSSSFAVTGELLTSTTLPFGALSAASMGDDLYAVYVTGGISREDPVPWESVILLRPSSADTITTVPSADVLFRSPSATSLLRTSLCRLAGFLVGSEEELWVASGIDGTLTEWRVDGRSAEPVRSARVAPEGDPLPDSTRTRLLGMLPRQLDAAAGDLDIPSTDSSICGLERSGDRTIWVRLHDLQSRERWVALDRATLRPTLELTAPEGVAMRAFSGSRGYGTWSDESGVSFVGIYRLE
jgi:hypothetical protein